MKNSFKDMTIKELVNGKTVTYQYYRSGNLWYITSDNFLFPVPISDVGEATFFKEDKAILFMRYIRKYKEEIERDTP